MAPDYDELTHRSMVELLRDATRHGQAVLRGEVRLAIAEAKDEVRQGARRAAWGMGAAIAGIATMVLLLAAAVTALARVMPTPAALLVVALVCGGAAWSMLRAAGGADDRPSTSMSS